MSIRKAKRSAIAWPGRPGLETYKGRKVKAIDARPLLRLLGKKIACEVCVLLNDVDTCRGVFCGYPQDNLSLAYVYDEEEQNDEIS